MKERERESEREGMREREGGKERRREGWRKVPFMEQKKSMKLSLLRRLLSRGREYTHTHTHTSSFIPLRRGREE